MVKVSAFDLPPPGVGLLTVTWAVPALATSDFNIFACNFPELLKVVTREDPFHNTCDVVTNPEPYTSIVNAALPALMLDGFSDVRLGTGLLMLNVFALEVPPPGAGLSTVTLAVPAAAMSLAGTVAWSSTLLTKVVVSW